LFVNLDGTQMTQNRQIYTALPWVNSVQHCVTYYFFVNGCSISFNGSRLTNII